MATPREELATLLRQARIDAGYESHATFGKHISVSRPVISKAENPAQPTPSDALLIAWSGATGVALNKLTELAERARSGTPDWFANYRSAEALATVIRSWAPMIVPGLLQTEAYARTVLSAEPFTPARLAELLSARLDRQGVLQRAYVTAVLDAGVLARCIGGAQVMADQCSHLVTVAEQSNVALHIVPADTNHGSWAALDIASSDGAITVNFSTATDDITSTAKPQVDRAVMAYERILTWALPKPASLDFMRQMEEQWKSQI